MGWWERLDEIEAEKNSKRISVLGWTAAGAAGLLMWGLPLWALLGR